MSKKIDTRNLRVVELADKILLNTSIPQENHAALRSGFAGYPANPRWSNSKVRAWKIGRQLKEALEKGDMVIRLADSMLIPTVELEDIPKLESSNSRSSPFPVWLKEKLINYQLMRS